MFAHWVFPIRLKWEYGKELDITAAPKIALKQWSIQNEVSHLWKSADALTECNFEFGCNKRMFFLASSWKKYHLLKDSPLQKVFFYVGVNKSTSNIYYINK